MKAICTLSQWKDKYTIKLDWPCNYSESSAPDNQQQLREVISGNASTSFYDLNILCNGDPGYSDETGINMFNTFFQIFSLSRNRVCEAMPFNYSQKQ